MMSRFAGRLWCAVDQSSSCGDGIFNWIEDGAAFEVNGKLFESSILQCYSYLVATPHFVGFKRHVISHGFDACYIGTPWRWVFRHPFFRKDLPNVIIKRPTKPEDAPTVMVLSKRPKQYKKPLKKRTPQTAPQLPKPPAPSSPVLALNADIFNIHQLLPPLDDVPVAAEAPYLPPTPMPRPVMPPPPPEYLKEEDVRNEWWFPHCLPYVPREPWQGPPGGYIAQGTLLPTNLGKRRPDANLFALLRDEQLNDWCMLRPPKPSPVDADGRLPSEVPQYSWYTVL
jgi:hypothetical protein